VPPWSAEDLRPRMSFSLRSAYAHGTRAIRTHLDSIAPQDDITWPVFRELQADWADRIALQAVCLIGCDKWTDDDGPFGHTADLVAETKGGVLGMVTYPMPTCATG
jgi:cytosine deaminase